MRNVKERLRMKIIKYPARIRGEDYTAEVRFCQCEYDMVMIQTELYKGLRKMGQKPEFCYRKLLPIEVFIRETEGEMRLMEEIHEN